jgi:hypothetical protein
MVIAIRHHYPVYVVASSDGVVVVATDGKDCILLFHARDIAEQQIARIQASHPRLGPLHALPIPNEQALREGLQDLPQNVTCAVWDATGPSTGFQHICLRDLLIALAS